jgi:hypothetical protein
MTSFEGSIDPKEFLRYLGLDRVTQSGGIVDMQYGAVLSLINEMGGKARVVCIPQGSMQALLWPIHNRLFEVLRTFPQDFTFDQLRCLSEIGKPIPEQWITESIDLSKATDEFPLCLQGFSLEFLFGQEVSES